MKRAMRENLNGLKRGDDWKQEQTSLRRKIGVEAEGAGGGMKYQMLRTEKKLIQRHRERFATVEGLRLEKILHGKTRR